MVQPLTYYGEVSPGVMYYHLNRFSKGVSEILREKIEIALLQQDLETVILDCRDNGGGMLTEAVGVINCFLPQGSRVLETRSVHKDKNRVFVCSDRNLLPDSVKLIILINGHSASASEITAGVIQDYDRGVIAGTASHGKGLVQNIVDLSNEDSFKITTSKYYIPSGRLIQTPSYLNESTVISSHFDSMTVFYTKGGRIVTENGGISPDTVLKASEGIMLLRDIEKKNLFFKFIRHEAVYNTDTLRWSEPETLYADFCSFLDEKKYEYKCPFAEEIRSLKNKLEKMDCLGAVSRADLNYLEQKVLEKDKIDNYKIRIIEKLYIEKEEFYGGRSAGLRQSLYSDSILLNAIRLSQSPEYKHLLQAGNRQK